MTNDDLVKLIDVIDSNSKIIGDVAGVAKNILAKDPNALDNSFLEFAIKSHLGESMYDRIHKIYQDIIGT
jgi:hypothetical protein